MGEIFILPNSMRLILYKCTLRYASFVLSYVILDLSDLSFDSLSDVDLHKCTISYEIPVLLRERYITFRHISSIHVILWLHCENVVVVVFSSIIIPT